MSFLDDLLNRMQPPATSAPAVAPLPSSLQTTPEAPEPEPNDFSAALASAGLVKKPSDDLEPMTSSILRGFLNQSSLTGDMPSVAQFDRQYRQSVSPAREVLANMMFGISSSMTGQKFLSLRQQKYQEWQQEQQRQMQEQQQQRLFMQARAQAALELYQRRQQQSFQTDLQNAKSTQGAVEFSLKYGQDAAKFELQKKEYELNKQKAELEQTREARAAQQQNLGTVQAKNNYQQALNEVFSQYQAKGIIKPAANVADVLTTLDPQTKVRFLNDVSTRSHSLDAADAALKQQSTEVDFGALGAPDPNSQSILAQTGLSYPAFLALTGQISRLPRDRASRTAALREAMTFANKRGVDVSTLSSQYESQNAVLAANIARMNNTKIMESELQGTIENLQSVVNSADLKRLNFANVAKVWAGQRVNDNLAQQYAMHLYQLRNELAAYGAATQGRSGNNITLDDRREAEQTIKNGIATGSLEGLSTAVSNSTNKMSGVMQRSVDTARKAVWDLFGVGGNYKSHRGPAVGTIEDGYRFKGGNPADPKNWEKQ